MKLDVWIWLQKVSNAKERGEGCVDTLYIHHAICIKGPGYR